MSAQEGVCETCNGRGEIGGWVGQTPESAGWDSVPCPDCERDYRVPRSKSHRLQAEAYRYYAQADRLYAVHVGDTETAASCKASADQHERLAGEYDRMAEALDKALAAQGSQP